jgi:hypothetical protein
LLDEKESEIVEKELKKQNWSIKNENIEIDIIFNIDLDIAIINDYLLPFNAFKSNFRRKNQ